MRLVKVAGFLTFDLEAFRLSFWVIFCLTRKFAKAGTGKAKVFPDGLIQVGCIVLSG
tara:strand:+ start:512 stop:682 length:171 start_codon:yes stop_codon:yes gene_type:complete